MIKWIDTTGGPIIILPAVKVTEWSGCYSTKSISAKEIIDAEDFLNPDESDYGKACQINDYVGIIKFSNSKAIVLGDMPLWTTFIKNEENEIIIVRWLFAESEREVEKYLDLKSIERIENWTNSSDYHSANNSHIMFDSAEIGFNLSEDKLLSFELKRGEYKIKTVEYKPDKSTSLLLHKFELKI